MLILFAIYLASLVFIFQQTHEKVGEQLDWDLGVPHWSYSFLVIGLMVGSCLGILAAALEHRRSAPSWILLIGSSAAALALCVWAASGGDGAVFLLFASSPPVAAVLSFAELMRQLRRETPAGS